MPSSAPARAIGSAVDELTSRQTTAASTVSPQAMPRKAIQPARASVPVPSEWSIATGQHAYASQCTAFHARVPILRRSKLVTTSASRRSNASAPSPSQNGRYGDRNGTKASRMPIGANESTTVVRTWMPVNATASSVRLRCSP